MRNGRRDAAAAGAKIEYARCLEAGSVACELKHVLDERFGVRSRDQHVARHFKFQAEEMRFAGEIFDRLLLGRALHEQLLSWVNRHYRDELRIEDLADPKLLTESRDALDELTKILKLGNLYEFQGA